LASVGGLELLAVTVTSLASGRDNPSAKTVESPSRSKPAENLEATPDWIYIVADEKDQAAVLTRMYVDVPRLLTYVFEPNNLSLSPH
jgi:hypothetical protein